MIAHLLEGREVAIGSSTPQVRMGMGMDFSFSSAYLIGVAGQWLEWQIAIGSSMLQLRRTVGMVVSLSSAYLIGVAGQWLEWQIAIGSSMLQLRSREGMDFNCSYEYGVGVAEGQHGDRLEPLSYPSCSLILPVCLPTYRLSHRRQS